MRILLTGASGHLGSALIPELIQSGHDVVGLVRSDAARLTVELAGATAVRGHLEDPQDLREAAREVDGVIHVAYDHSLAFSGSPEGYAAAAALDLRAIQAFGEALAGSGKPLLTTAGTALFAFAGLGRTITEDDVLPAGPRIDSENATAGLRARGVRSVVVRLPPVVHSDLDRAGFVPTLIERARSNGFSAYVGDGANVWPAAHTRDVARLYRLALESAPAGTRLQAVAEEVSVRAIAEAIGQRLELPTKSVRAEEAPSLLGFLAGFAGVNNPASSARTRALLQWSPERPGLLDDIGDGYYFRRASLPNGAVR